MAIDPRGVKAVCKRCGKSALSNEYVLDPVYRMMVCPNCVKERKDKEQRERQKAKKDADSASKAAEQKAKPAGWDAEDEYLARSAKSKETNVIVERLDQNRVRYTCPKCRYKFVYDTEKRKPNVCPYCGSEIMSFSI